MPRPFPFGPAAIRAAMVRQVLALVGGGDLQQEARRKDAGLFGPDSPTWKVHGDFTSMMVGGITALLLQMLHPGALAGVWDHSNFRKDMIGRLKNTARFIAGTTYGDRDEAQGLIDRVLAVHAPVVGVLPDGTPYSANDPHLLTWVHVAEVSSFLAAYLRYVDPAMSGEAQDRYYHDASEIARRLGATDIPMSRAEVAAFLTAVRPELAYDERTREVSAVLLAERPPSPAAAPAMAIAFDAAKDLLPDWAAAMHGFALSPARRAAARTGVRVLGRTMRWALVNSAEARARRGVAERARSEARP